MICVLTTVTFEIFPNLNGLQFFNSFGFRLKYSSGSQCMSHTPQGASLMCEWNRHNFYLFETPLTDKRGKNIEKQVDKKLKTKYFSVQRDESILKDSNAALLTYVSCTK